MKYLIIFAVVVALIIWMRKQFKNAPLMPDDFID